MRVNRFFADGGASASSTLPRNIEDAMGESQDRTNTDCMVDPFYNKENEDHNRASLAERRSIAEHLQELRGGLVQDQQDWHSSFRGLQERIQHLHSVLSGESQHCAAPSTSQVPFLWGIPDSLTEQRNMNSARSTASYCSCDPKCRPPRALLQVPRISHQQLPRSPSTPHARH